MHNNININNNEKNNENDLVTTFKLPIAFINKDKLHEIDAHVMTDLELIETGIAVNNNDNNVNNNDNDTSKPKQKTMYEHVFDPKTIYGKQFLDSWAKYYTSDVTFLKESQTLLGKFDNNKDKDNDNKCKTKTYLEIHDIWKSIQGDKHFKDKFGYIDIAMLDRARPLYEKR